MQRWSVLVLGLMLVVAPLAGCVQQPGSKSLPTATAVPPTTTAAPSPTPVPTATPTPAATPTARPTTPVEFLPATPRVAQAVGAIALDGTFPTGTGGYPWWNDTVFYEIFVRSFYDSDGDGIGDFRGLIEKLDYLNDGDPTTTDDLGITGIWLMPINPSPSYHGYDVVDYYDVNPEYGTLEDFHALLEAAHARGIRVIIDLVLNHTSTQHPWFQESRDPNSLRRDWYLWSDTRPTGSGWHRDSSGAYYYGIFWDQMPDLNYENPAVTAEMQKVIRFWLEDVGVDGFRLDAIKHLIEENGVLENTPGTLAWFEDFYGFYKGIAPEAFTVGEVWSSTDKVTQYVGDKVDVAFEFELADAMIKTAFNARPGAVRLAQETVNASYPPGQFATFLANHDQPRTRSRLMNDEQAKVAATLQLTFGGVPFVYYGEELGMMGAKPDENIRRPMQWTAEGGFSTGRPWRDYYEDYRERHVAGQNADPNSLLNHYRTLIGLRYRHEALRIGAWLPVEADRTPVYSTLRYTENELLLTLVNLSNQPVDDYSLTLARGPFVPGMQPAFLLGSGTLFAPPVNAAGGFAPYRPVDVLPPYGSVVLQFLP